jgi:molybdenum cofactor cytidylyltransferase
VPGPERLAVALLAAGASRRFGDTDKLAADLGGRPLIDWAAAAGRSVDAAQHFVVTSPDFLQRLCPGGYEQLVNAAAGEGMGTSLRLAALRAREAGADALLVLLADMPLVAADHLAALLAAASDDRPVFSRGPDGAAQPPALFPAALFPTLEAMAGDKGARALAGNALFIAASAETLHDVDTSADLARCRSLLGL